MKKILTITTVILILILFAGLAVRASDDYYSVVDSADLLTETQLEELNARADEITQNYKCEVVIIAVEDLRDFGYDPDYDQDAAYECATYIHREFGYGYGEDKSCVMLFFSAAGGKGNRDYALIAYGYGNEAFTDYGKDVMLDNYILPLLGEDKFYEAFSKYLDKAEEFLKMAREGTPFDYDTDTEVLKERFYTKLFINILAPIIIAHIVCSAWKSKMKTAKIAGTADNYIPANGFRLTGQQDLFLYRTTTKHKIERSSSSGSRGGTTRRSGGYSGRSGKI